MGTALDTLCGQAFGAKQHHMLGIHLQRGMLVLTLVSVPIAILWAFTGQILILLHQDREISIGAGVYIRYMIPALFGYAILQCHNRFLKSQRIVVPLMLSSGITTLIHVLVCWVLVYKCGLGNKGAALANSVSYWINALVLAVYVRVSAKCKATWTGFSKEAVHDTLNFIKLAIPSAAMIWYVQVNFKEICFSIYTY